MQYKLHWETWAALLMSASLYPLIYILIAGREHVFAVVLFGSFLFISGAIWAIKKYPYPAMFCFTGVLLAIAFLVVP